MNIKEVNRVLESELSTQVKVNKLMREELGIQLDGTSIDLKSFYDLRTQLNCSGDYDDFYFKKKSETSMDGRGDPYCHVYVCRIYYDARNNTIRVFCDSEANEFNSDDEYYYDPQRDDLVPKENTDNAAAPFGMNFALNDALGYLCTNRLECIKYYKCCKQDIPWFKPFKIECDLIIDSELNMFKDGVLIANLSDLVTISNNPIGYNRDDIENLKNLLNTLTIKVSDLPKLYKDYFEQKKNQI